MGMIPHPPSVNHTKANVPPARKGTTWIDCALDCAADAGELLKWGGHGTQWWCQLDERKAVISYAPSLEAAAFAFCQREFPPTETPAA